jgi:hypothetical protein
VFASTKTLSDVVLPDTLQGAAAAMNSTVAPGLMLNIMMTVEPEEMKLLAVLFDTNASECPCVQISIHNITRLQGTHVSSCATISHHRACIVSF